MTSGISGFFFSFFPSFEKKRRKEKVMAFLGFKLDVWNAARSGNLHKLTSALASHANLIDTPHPDKRRQTPMYIAAENGHVEIIEKLVELGSRAIDTPDHYGRTPMYIAAVNGHAPVIEILVRLGSTAIDTPNNTGRTPMFAAAFFKHPSVIETLARLGSRAIDTPDNHDRTPLYVAACFYRIDLVKTLKMLGAKRSIVQEKDVFYRVLECLNTQVDENETEEVRSRVYFSRSLMERLFLELEVRRNRKTIPNAQTRFN